MANEPSWSVSCNTSLVALGVKWPKCRILNCNKVRWTTLLDKWEQVKQTYLWWWIRVWLSWITRIAIAIHLQMCSSLSFSNFKTSNPETSIRPQTRAKTPRLSNLALRRGSRWFLRNLENDFIDKVNSLTCNRNDSNKLKSGKTELKNGVENNLRKKILWLEMPYWPTIF